MVILRQDIDLGEFSEEEISILREFISLRTDGCCFHEHEDPGSGPGNLYDRILACKGRVNELSTSCLHTTDWLIGRRGAWDILHSMKSLLEGHNETIMKDEIDCILNILAIFDLVRQAKFTGKQRAQSVLRFIPSIGPPLSDIVTRLVSFIEEIPDNWGTDGENAVTYETRFRLLKGEFAHWQKKTIGEIQNWAQNKIGIKD